MTNIFSNPDSIRPPGGNYTHSVEVEAGSRMLYVAGQTGMALDLFGSAFKQPLLAVQRLPTKRRKMH